MVEKKAARYRQRPSQSDSASVSGSDCIRFWRWRLDDVVFSIGYEEELKREQEERRFLASLHDKKMR